MAPSPYHGAPAHHHQHQGVATHAAPAYETTRSAPQSQPHQTRAQAALKPAYQQLLDALESQQRGERSAVAGRLRGPAPDHTRHRDKRADADSPLQRAPGSSAQRQPFVSVTNTMASTPQYGHLGCIPQRYPDEHAGPQRADANCERSQYALDPRVRDHGERRQHWHSARAVTPTLGTPQGGTALERMQRLHDRLKASEADVHRRLGRLLRPPNDR